MGKYLTLAALDRHVIRVGPARRIAAAGEVVPLRGYGGWSEAGVSGPNDGFKKPDSEVRRGSASKESTLHHGFCVAQNAP